MGPGVRRDDNPDNAAYFVFLNGYQLYPGNSNANGSSIVSRRCER